MRIRDLLPLSINALLVNKARSALTMLGIIIGIASVMLMVSVGEAAQKYLLSQVASFGSDLIFIEDGPGDGSESNGPPNSLPKQNLTVRDYEKLQNLSWTKAVAGSVITSDIIAGQGAEKRTTVNGSSPDELEAFNSKLGEGRFIDDEDVASRGRVIVIGIAVADKLFGEEDPIGRTVKLSRQPFRVIGVMAPGGTRFFQSLDDQVYIPFTAFFDLYNKNRLNFLSVKSGDVRPAEAKELIRIALRETHDIDNPDNVLKKDDFNVSSQEDAVQTIGTISTVLQILLGAVASISLFVAGIGIMNIMYVTITERTREIGLRKAIGATKSDILRQFLAEAIMLTSVAGIIGMMVGFFLSWIAIQIILRFQGGWEFVIPWTGAGIAFGVSAAIGVIFGYFPARRAAKLNPIEALRYE
ncbi:MAG: ABC transporter permease [Patescibacteria group bacterium]|jgi:putative ABC transport system permease protein